MILYYILIWFSPYVKHPLMNLYVGGGTVIKYLGLACAIYAIFYTLVHPSRWPNPFHSFQVRAFFMFLLLAAVSYISAPIPFSLENNPLIMYMSQGVNLFITVCVVDSVERVRNVLLVSIAAVAYASVHIIREWVAGSRVYAGYRPGWVAGDANSFAAITLLILPIAFVFLRYGRSWMRYFCIGCIILISAAFMLCSSRGALVALVAMFPLFVWRSETRMRDAAVGTFLVAGLLGTQLMFPHSSLMRLITPSVSDEESAESRTQMWALAGRMIRSHPLLGVGLGSFAAEQALYSSRPSDRKFAVPHNTFIEITTEMGTVGVLAFFGVILCSLRSLRRVQLLARAVAGTMGKDEAVFITRMRRARYGTGKHAPESRGAELEQLSRWAVALETGLFGFLVSLMTFSGQYEKLFWLLVFLSASIAVLSARIMRELIQSSPSRQRDLSRRAL